MLKPFYLKLLAILMLATAIFAPVAALASGEVYSWKDSSTQAIEASGGAYAMAVELTPVSGHTGDYSGTTQITCSTGTNAATVTATLADAKAAPGTPVAATIATSPATPCPTTSLDASVQIGAPGSSAAVSGTSSTAKVDKNKCDQGALSWILCPIIDKVEQTISWAVTKVVEPLLKVSPLSPTNTASLYNAWSSVRTLADVLLIIILLVIISANVLSFGLDSYTIKRSLPRLVIAVIAIQFSFMIATFAVDLSNIVGANAGNLILGALHPAASSGGGAVVENFAIALPAIVVGIGVAITSWALLIPILVSLLIGVFAFFLTLGARLLLIAVLVVISPLAFVAYILPNTNNYYKQWQKLFVRLLLMYPVIMVLLAVAGRLNELLSFADNTGNNGASQVAISLLKPFIFIFVFSRIPKTFQWAGSWMSDFSGLINKYRDKGIAKNKEAGYYKDAQAKRRDKQLEYTRRLADSKSIKSLTNSNSRMARGAGGFLLGAGGVALGGAPNNPLAFNRAYSKQTTDYKKELDDLRDADNPYNIEKALAASAGDADAIKYLENKAPSLLRYTKSQAGRMALVSKRVDSGTLAPKDLNQFLNPARDKGSFMRSTPDLSKEYPLALAAAGKDYGKRPFLIARLNEDNPEYKLKDQLGRTIIDSNTVEDDDGNRIHVPNVAPAEVLGPKHVGDVDINAVKGQVRKLTQAALADDDKFSPANLDVAIKDTTNGVGKALAFAFAEEAPVAVLKKAMDPDSRNPMSKVKRVDFVRMIEAHKEMFLSGHGKDVKEALLENLPNDRDVLVELAQRAGVDRATAQIDTLQQKNINLQRVRNWLA